MLLQLSAEGVAGLKASEGLQLVSYLDRARKWTIGFGRTKGVQPDMTCTPAQAEKWLIEDCADALEAIMRLFPGKKFTQPQIDALAMFIFNLGESKVRGYGLTRLINEDAPTLEIARKWLEYIYTIGDGDGDGVSDAIIDPGLPIRRYREVLLWHGFSWPVCEAAANANNLDLSEHRVNWNGGYKEILTNPTPIEDVIARARNIASFLDEEQPEETLFEELVIPTRGAVPPAPEPKAPAPVMQTAAQKARSITVPDDWDDMNEEAQVAWLNGSQETKLKAAAPAKPMIVAKVIETPALKPDATPKPMEKSETFRGLSKADSGKETALIGGTVLGATAYALPYAEKASAYVEKYPPQTIMIVLGAFAGMVFIYGAWRWWRGQIIAYEGRVNASEPKV